MGISQLPLLRFRLFNSTALRIQCFTLHQPFPHPRQNICLCMQRVNEVRNTKRKPETPKFNQHSPHSPHTSNLRQLGTIGTPSRTIHIQYNNLNRQHGDHPQLATVNIRSPKRGKRLQQHNNRLADYTGQAKRTQSVNRCDTYILVADAIHFKETATSHAVYNCCHVEPIQKLRLSMATDANPRTPFEKPRLFGRLIRQRSTV